jgi:hypothetical protein
VDNIEGICKMGIANGDNIPKIEKFEEISGHFCNAN